MFSLLSGCFEFLLRKEELKVGSWTLTFVHWLLR